MPAIERPFFLVGSERSGTTLLRLMLSHHPRIDCAPEFEFLVEFPGFAGKDTDVRAYAEWLATDRIFGAYGLTIDPSLDFVALANDFLWQYCGRSGKPIIGATCHKHFDKLRAIWPRPRYVHLLRDGRDVARSCVQMGWAGNVWYGVDRWIAAEHLWERIIATTEAEDRFELKYEDLIMAPERELGRLCEFLGTPFDPKMMEYANESSYEKPDPKLVQQWKRKLSAKELALLEGKVGTLLRARGYEASGVDPVVPGPVELARLKVEDRVGRLRFRVDRYGPANVVAMKLARMIGPRAWERAMVLKLNEIDNQHMR
jgi:hypothetical protein